MLSTEPSATTQPSTTPSAALDCARYLTLAGDGVDPIGNGVAAIALIQAAVSGQVEFPASHVREVGKALLGCSLALKVAVVPELSPLAVEFGVGAAFALVGQMVVDCVESPRLYANRIDHLALFERQLQGLQIIRRIRERGDVMADIAESHRLAPIEDRPPTLH